MKARLLAAQPFPDSRRQAIGLLEGLDRQQAMSLNDQRLLAELYDSVGDTESADARWQSLLDNHEQEALVLSSYIRRQLSRNKNFDAEHWLMRLKSIAPESFDAVQYQAVLSIRSGKTGDAINVMNGYIANQEQTVDRAGRLRRAIALLERNVNTVSITDDARKQIQRAIHSHYKTLIVEAPQNRVNYAVYLARQGMLKESLDLCESIASSDNPLPSIAAAISALRTTNAETVQIQRVEGWLAKALTAQPKSTAGMLQLADLRDLQRRYRDAIQIHRRILELSPKNVIALNNLAWLLSYASDSHHKEAAGLIDKAIGVAGPMAVLLDTRGSIRLNHGSVKAAIADFRDSLSQVNNAVVRVHLALAYWKSKDQRAARYNYETAIKDGFEESMLHALELRDYRELQAELAAK